MKKKLTIITICLIIILMLGICFSNISNAAIESKPGATKHDTTNNIAYQYCYDMRSSTSTLGNNSLDPHLILNKDWGAVVYLGASSYGGIRRTWGIEFKINDSYHLSTTNNITGIMDMGIVSSGGRTTNVNEAISAYVPHPFNNNGEGLPNLYANKDTKYVEVLSSFAKEDTIGMALGETSGWYGTTHEGGSGLFYRKNSYFTTFDSGDFRTTARYHAAIWN